MVVLNAVIEYGLMDSDTGQLRCMVYYVRKNYSNFYSNI